MYAIISCGGKQYKVSAGDVIEVEKLENEPNTTIKLQALLVSDDKGVKVGNPNVEGVEVSATVLEHGKGEKIAIAVYKKMNGHHHAQGHRQPYTKIRIDNIK